MAPLFESGKTYTFYFSQEHGDTSITGEVVSYESPLVKIETEGLTTSSIALPLILWRPWPREKMRL